jgi:hypothetical protein
VLASVAWHSACDFGPQIVRSPAHKPGVVVLGFHAVGTHVQGGIFLSCVAA